MQELALQLLTAETNNTQKCSSKINIQPSIFAYEYQF
ncbi:hypothetical protein NIES267_49230 [Calothrix parasitica NIES-267]|uniref:Uncharacterized protein n=1 Tax=Calothrix parasitica NIES-267 TaxID=1973488 RepID=A0A1Z4LW29_9CYAN|nr:hypothetical protein NIES267_49230 [Calothrix parasitica NIES-267]